VRRSVRALACRPISASSAAAWTAVSTAPGAGGGGGAGSPAGLRGALGLAATVPGLAVGLGGPSGLAAAVVRAGFAFGAAGALALSVGCTLAAARAGLALAPARAGFARGPVAGFVAGAATGSAAPPAGAALEGSAAGTSGRLSLRRWGRVWGREPRTPGWRGLLIVVHDRAPRSRTSVPSNLRRNFAALLVVVCIEVNDGAGSRRSKRIRAARPNAPPGPVACLAFKKYSGYSRSLCLSSEPTL
jgi:hypothetical protein